MISGYFNITTQQSLYLNFHIEYYDENENRIDLSGQSVRFQVRPNYGSSFLYLSASNIGVTVGGTAGKFIENDGIPGTGGIYINSGETGGNLIGGIRVVVDSETMKYLSPGSWKYSLEIGSDDLTQEILQGEFIVLPKT